MKLVGFVGVSHVRLDNPMVTFLLFPFADFTAQMAFSMPRVGAQFVVEDAQPGTWGVPSVTVDGAEDAAPAMVRVKRRAQRQAFLSSLRRGVGFAQDFALEVAVVNPPSLEQASLQ